MKTFVAHDVLLKYDYTPGMVVVSAANLTRAKLVVHKDKHIDPSSKGDICQKLKELPPNTADFIVGGG